MLEPVSGQQLAALAREARERWSVPGLAVGVLREGSLVCVSTGTRELGRDDPVTPATVFRIASITKPFVATLALTLAQDGLLELDAPPPGTQVEATVRQLLSHQGGLACEWPQPLDGFGDADDALLRLAEGAPEPLPFGPGELFSYCNVGYWLVGAASARAARATFEQALRSRVLEPLRLEATGFEPDRPARGHNQLRPGGDEQRPVHDSYPRIRRPSGGLWSSVEELLRFGAHHLGGPGPLTPESIAELQRPQIGTGSEAYGLGWSLSERAGRRIVEHGGSAVGYQSLLRLVPDEGLAFAGLTNSSRGAAALRDVLDSLGLGPEEAPGQPVTTAELAVLSGHYRGQGIELEVRPEDGRLRIERAEVDPFTGETQVYPSVRARPLGGRQFELVDGEWRGERFDFPRAGLVRLGTIAARIE